MSIFSRLKMSKKAAKEHKAKTQQTTDERPKVPYKHVPTHAGIDALSGAPSSWKHEDKPKIMEHHKRRSLMTASRAGSSLSARTWTEQGNNPSVPSLLRNNSYNSFNPTWNDRGDFSYLNEPYQKRKRASRNTSFIDSGIGPSPLGSNTNSKHVSPSGSSKSSLTDENLEIGPRKRPTASVFQPSYHPGDAFQHLQSQARKVGETSVRPVSEQPATVVAPPVPTVPVVAVAAVPVVEKPQKRRWTLKGKMRATEIGVAS